MKKNSFISNDIKIKNKSEIISLSNISDAFLKLLNSAYSLNSEIIEILENAMEQKTLLKYKVKDILDIYYNFSLYKYSYKEYEEIRICILNKLKYTFNDLGYDDLEEISKEELNKDIKVEFSLEELYLIITNYAQIKKVENDEDLPFIKKVKKQLEKSNYLNYLDKGHELEEILGVSRKNIDKILLSSELIIDGNTNNDSWLLIGRNLYSLNNCLSITNLNNNELTFLYLFLIDNDRLIDAKKEDLPLIMTILSRFEDEDNVSIIIQNILNYMKRKDDSYCNNLEYIEKHEINNSLPLIRQFEVRILNGEKTDDIYDSLDNDNEKDLLVKAYYNLLNKNYLIAAYNINPKDLEIVDLPFCYNNEINKKLLNLTKGNLPKFRI